MAQTAVALAVVAVALGVFINFSIHKIEEGEQRSVPVAVPILIATDRSRCLILVWRLTSTLDIKLDLFAHFCV